MDNYQKVEQLVNKAGCSYEDAKTALEACGWDMIDAIISLERDGKVKKETAEKKFEAAEEAIPEITPEVIPESKRFDGDAGQNSSGKTGSTKDGSKPKRGLWARIKSMLMNNRMLIIRGNGQQIADFPILVPMIALLMFFWATLGIAVVAMLLGFRFHFEGEDLGKTNINKTMDKATDYAEKVKDNLAGKSKNE